MVNDLAWEGFGERTKGIIEQLTREHFEGVESYNRMLSVVMPGHSIEEHSDPQPPGWLARVHVPLVTNERSEMVLVGVPHHLEVGSAYLVNVQALHSVRNPGHTPRIHLMFDVRSNRDGLL